MFGNQSRLAGLFVAFFLVLFTGCTEGAPTAPEQIEAPAGQVATRIVEAEDTVEYYCRYHPNMTGTIKVR